MNEHENDAGVTPAVARKEGEGVGVVEELVAEGPVDGSCGWQGEGEHINCGYKINVLELLRLPHCMHDFPVLISHTPSEFIRYDST